MFQETSLLAKVKKHVAKTLQIELPKSCKYHDYEHTKGVVDAFLEIGKACQLTDTELELGCIAAYFHDTGHSINNTDHEANSVKLMREFLRSHKVSEEKIEVVANAILSTRIPQRPKSSLEKVLCDADLYNLGSEQFFERTKLLKEELDQVNGEETSMGTWYHHTYVFLSNHKYFTNYAIQNLEPKKLENMAEVKSKVEELNQQDPYIKELEKKVKKLEKKVILKPDRGIETMFRITSKNHLQLSSMADNKANIMISVNTIIVSILISFVMRNIPSYPNLLIPVVSLTLVCLTTIVLSILATRPNVSKGRFSNEDILSKKTNLLFFGNFHGMELKEYEWGIREMMKDADFLYGSLTKDIYFLGKVLGKKYRLLHAAYTTFMIGFVISILLFLLAYFYLPEDAIYYY